MDTALLWYSATRHSMQKMTSMRTFFYSRTQQDMCSDSLPAASVENRTLQPAILIRSLCNTYILYISYAYIIISLRTDYKEKTRRTGNHGSSRLHSACGHWHRCHVMTRAQQDNIESMHHTVCNCRVWGPPEKTGDNGSET